MTQKIFRSILTVSAAVLLTCLISVAAVLFGYFSSTEEENFNRYLTLAVQGVESSGEEYIKSLSGSDYRLSWIGADGTVLYDTVADHTDMENHLDREEMREALETGWGESSRYSDTLTRKMTYCAQRLSDGSVLRIAINSSSVFSVLFSALVPVLGIFIVTVVISAFISKKMAQSIVRPLGQLDLENPEKNDTYEELSPILGRLGVQHGQIAEQLKQLRRKTDEFEQIITSMNEGLILLDKNATVLSMNTAAERIFGVNGHKIGCDFLEVDRSEVMNAAVKNALGGNHSEFAAEKNGRQYRFSISPTVSGGRTLGAVILGFDITERQLAEQSRKEFTANVSHELKTPLQSILGSVELLESDLVKKEDRPRFLGHIRSEATRLVSLINDIIRLSQLEESGAVDVEQVPLLRTAAEAIKNLEVFARQKNVTLSVTGEEIEISGQVRYIYEIIYNLCDNAIRYNVEGGSVIIDIGRRNKETVISVSDTGIGIPPEHQTRIFERFYRVDKSHSRETGGTGLGLSIVKHAVLLHGGRIELDSAVGEGTTVRVIL